VNDTDQKSTIYNVTGNCYLLITKCFCRHSNLCYHVKQKLQCKAK